MEEERYDKTDLPVCIMRKHGINAASPVVPCAHYHNSYEICICQHSTLRAFMQNKWYEVQDGDILFIPQYEMHRYEYLEKERYTRLLISVSDEYLRGVLASMHCQGMFDSLDMKKCMHIRPKSAQFRSLYQHAEETLTAYEQMKSSPDEEEKAVFRARFFCLLYELRPLMTEVQQEVPLSKACEYVQNTINYIDRHYAEQLTLDELAEVSHVDKYHLCHVFKRHTGMSVVKYMHSRRVIEAEKLLLYTDKAADVIACSVGFCTMQHFYRVFREITGKSPGEYRGRLR